MNNKGSIVMHNNKTKNGIFRLGLLVLLLPLLMYVGRVMPVVASGGYTQIRQEAIQYIDDLAEGYQYREEGLDLTKKTVAQINYLDDLDLLEQHEEAYQTHRGNYLMDRYLILDSVGLITANTLILIIILLNSGKLYHTIKLSREGLTLNG